MKATSRIGPTSRPPALEVGGRKLRGGRLTNRARRIDSESGQPLRFPGAPDWDLDVANVAVNPSLSHHSVRGAWDLPRTSRSGTTARLSRSRSPQGANFSAFPGAVLVILQR